MTLLSTKLSLPSKQLITTRRYACDPQRCSSLHKVLYHSANWTRPLFVNRSSSWNGSLTIMSCIRWLFDSQLFQVISGEAFGHSVSETNEIFHDIVQAFEFGVLQKNMSWDIWSEKIAGRPVPSTCYTHCNASFTNFAFHFDFKVMVNAVMLFEGPDFVVKDFRVAIEDAAKGERIAVGEGSAPSHE